jgi:hypothetical protein
MNINPQHIEALKSIQRRLGDPFYNEQEARFLYLVATHSGYFIQRQYLTFRDQKYGYAIASLVSKVLEKGHGRQRRYQGHGNVYHLFGRALYAAIEQQDNRNRRVHQLEHLQGRLAALDYVLAHQEAEYLETEDQKVSYFTQELQLPMESLPKKISYGKNQNGTTARYFPDNFPLFLSRTEDAPHPLITFTFMDAGRVGFGQYLTHLIDYQPLFKQLHTFRFAFASSESSRFGPAARHFSRVVLDGQGACEGPTELLRYFHLCAAREAKDYAKLSMENIHFYADAERIYGAERYQALYRKWRRGEASEAEVMEHSRQQSDPIRGRFETYTLPSNRYIFRPQRVGEQKLAS